ncbi:MAG: IS200/IS605 family element transposase accessory protein TnpB [Moorea sp. SIO4A3]|nr:IS200/IS605 family element transposase accessory protein TnpB [Moorena sp. SIO4A3]
MKARYKYRFYPTDQQKQDLARLFGCVRVVWNDALAICKKYKKVLKSGDLQKLVITQAKKTEERKWLSEVSVVPLQQSVADLGVAFKNFFESHNGKRKGRKVRSPRFKKRSNNQSARLTRRGFSIQGDGVYLAKIGVVKPIWSRELPSDPSSVTIILDCANNYFLSFVVDIKPVQVDAKNQSIGIDLGIKTFAVMSDGGHVKSPDYSKLDRKLRKQTRKFARQAKGSNRREQTRIKIARLNKKIANKRKDFLHKFSTRIVSENQVIVLEDLNVSGMVKNRKLARAISQQGWSEFRSLAQAKSDKYGRDFRVISRWEPTSQICSDCGFKWGKLDLSVRSILCVNCGTEQDRDINAARNIEKVGMGHRHDSKWARRGDKTVETVGHATRTAAHPDDLSRIAVLLGR